jgi:2-phosphoglycerate kinase
MSEARNKALETEEAEFVIMACNNVIIDAVHAHARLLTETVTAVIDLVKRTAEGCKTLEEFVRQIDLMEDRRAKRTWDRRTQGTKKSEEEQCQTLEGT